MAVSNNKQIDIIKSLLGSLTTSSKSKISIANTRSSSNWKFEMQQNSASKPLVALLDGRNCSIEMPILKSFAIFAFCDAQTAGEIHHKVLNEASAALLWSTMTLTRDDLLKFKALKLIVRIGSSIDNIDVEAAGELGIAVSNIPGCCVDEMADSTMAMILTLYRGTSQLNFSVRDGRVPFTPEQTAEACSRLRRIRGQTLGIVGLGRIGSAVAIRALAFGFKVMFYDPFVKEGIERSLGVQRSANLTDLLHVADCVTLHCPFNVHTHRLINESTLHHFKRGSFLVNTASGFLIDEGSLSSALKDGILSGAALDVYESNCMNMPSAALKDMPNLICTPRTAWYSDKSSHEAREEAAQEVKRALLGRIPESLLHCINKDLLVGTKLLRERALPTSSQSVISSQQPSGSPGSSRIESISSIMTQRRLDTSNSTGAVNSSSNQPNISSNHHSTHLASSIAAVAANQQQQQQPNNQSGSNEHGGGLGNHQPQSSRKRHSPQRQSQQITSTASSAHAVPARAGVSSAVNPLPCNIPPHFPHASIVARFTNPESGIPYDADEFYASIANAAAMGATIMNPSSTTTSVNLSSNPSSVGSASDASRNARQASPGRFGGFSSGPVSGHDGGQQRTTLPQQPGDGNGGVPQQR